MIILDNHENHHSIQFEDFYKEKNIITLCLPAHSSHITQSLDVSCFNVLKRIYGRKLEIFIWAHINHITKTEFFIAFKAAHNKTMIINNVQASFRRASLIPYDPQTIISKLDIKLRTPTPTEAPPFEADS